MKKNFILGRAFALTLALIFVLSSVIALVSCSNDDDKNGDGTPASTISITLEVIGPDGSSKEHKVSTDSSKNLGQALMDAGLIEGEEGAYGLYVKVVDGITADHDVDQSWWGLYKDGEMLMTGVDSTPIADGDHFEFVYSK